jgi:hypothetical protein
MKKFQILTGIAAILLIATACSFGANASATPTTDENSIATVVASTLTALSPASGAPSATLAASAPTATITAAHVLRLAIVDSARDLWSWQPGGSPVLLVSTGDVTEAHFSSDGSLIAYVRSSADGASFSLEVIHSDGNSQHTLVSSTDFSAMPRDPSSLGVGPYEVAWIPGTHVLAYNTRTFFEGPGLAVNNDLRLVNADTLAQSVLMAPGSGGMFYFSPDGSKVAVTTPTTISLFHADGSVIANPALTYPAVKSYSEAAFYAAPVWSSDSTQLKVIIPPADPLAASLETVSIWKIPTDGNPATQIGTISSAPFVSVTLSPDLNRIAYLVPHGTPSDNIRELHIANADGSGDSLFATAQMDFNNWAPDSAHFVYSNWTPATTQLGLLGSSGVTLSDFLSVQNVEWIDATHFLFMDKNGSNWEIRLEQVGSPSTFIFSTAAGSNYTPSFDFSD